LRAWPKGSTAPPYRPGVRLRPGGRIRARPRRRAGQDLQGRGYVLRAVGICAPGGPESEQDGEDAPPRGDPAPPRRQRGHGPGVEEGVIMVDRRVIAACWVVRLALAASFLSAVADRLGLWGPPGSPGVSWGSVPKYEEYVAQLNWFLPAGLVPVAGWAATACEGTLAIGLLIGWRLPWGAFSAGVLFTSVSGAMGVAPWPQSPPYFSLPLRGGGGVPVGRTDVPVGSSNGAGVCRACACGLIFGSVKHNPEPLEPAAAENLLICCSRPQEDVVIDISREIPI